MNQVALPLGERPKTADIDVSMLIRQPDMLAAINLGVNASGLQDNQIYPVLGIEKASWSKSLGGSNHFDANKLDSLCSAIGNEIPLEWWAMFRGYKLVKLKSTLEEENEALKAELKEARRENEIIKKFVKETQ